MRPHQSSYGTIARETLLEIRVTPVPPPGPGPEWWFLGAVFLGALVGLILAWTK